MSDPDTQAALREMSRSIGGLESTVKTLVSTWQSQEIQASQGRRDLHQKFDALSEKVSVLAGKVEAAIKDITEIKPSVEAFETAKERAVGASMFGKVLWGIAVFMSGGFGWILSNWINVSPKTPIH
ncbi:DUF1515 family protein [Bradyrhizobium sp. sGM-13]|uniref:DUF1515 family protein n=1 Tax=Bradyrhizobium sp. sGM-13 TaxID=2831781 RepID=UPI0028125049|nr:DUF1515 family protein [Bradyrhizobium sp. sGM-13]